jgi:hypothetical protein
MNPDPALRLPSGLVEVILTTPLRKSLKSCAMPLTGQNSNAADNQQTKLPRITRQEPNLAPSVKSPLHPNVAAAHRESNGGFRHKVELRLYKATARRDRSCRTNCIIASQ